MTATAPILDLMTWASLHLKAGEKLTITDVSGRPRTTLDQFTVTFDPPTSLPAPAPPPHPAVVALAQLVETFADRVIALNDAGNDLGGRRTDPVLLAEATTALHIARRARTAAEATA
ncbi:hypothetical protein ACWEQ4_01120 [Rhodococcus sp. NPDC003994]